SHAHSLSCGAVESHPGVLSGAAQVQSDWGTIDADRSSDICRQRDVDVAVVCVVRIDKDGVVAADWQHLSGCTVPSDAKLKRRLQYCAVRFVDRYCTEAIRAGQCYAAYSHTHSLTGRTCERQPGILSRPECHTHRWVIDRDRWSKIF